MDGILIPTSNNAAPSLFTPETQRAAAKELNTMLSEALQPYIGKDCDERNLHNMRLAIQTTLKTWFKKHPTLTKLKIDFDLDVDKQQGKITIKPSFDFQRLIAGMIPY
jgi:hypothetical protein